MSTRLSLEKMVYQTINNQRQIITCIINKDAIQMLTLFSIITVC